ncbi:UNVERIFIED_CONTAM: hypothetical protein K2H54_058239 [Gekko kuhli]
MSREEEISVTSAEKRPVPTTTLMSALTTLVTTTQIQLESARGAEGALSYWWLQGIQEFAWFTFHDDQDRWAIPGFLTAIMGTKLNPLRPKDGTRDLRMKQGLCLQCVEAGHFAIDCPGVARAPVPSKEVGKKCQDTPLRKRPVKVKVQRVLQFRIDEKGSSLNSSGNEESVGKGRDLL